MISPNAPTVRYYQAVRGTWSGRYQFAITDWAAMREAVPALMDRIRLSLLHRLGRLQIATSVTFSAANEVLHTTRVTMWGIPGLNSAEWFRLNDDGRAFSVRMIQRLAPLYWLERCFPEGSGMVDDPDVGARYQLPWIGGTIEQTVRFASQGIRIEQSTPWFRGDAQLDRRNMT